MLSPEQLEARIKVLMDTCTYTVYNYTRRGLFDRDKLIVLTLLTFTIQLRSGPIDTAEYDALCKGARSSAPPPITDDLSRWMSESQWAAVDALACIPGFAALAKDLEKNSDEWSNWCLNEAAERAPMPGEWSKMSDFKQLLLLRALRPDRITNALQRYCEGIMGSAYVNQDAFSPEAVMSESTRYARPASIAGEPSYPRCGSLWLTRCASRRGLAVFIVSGWRPDGIMLLRQFAVIALNTRQYHPLLLELILVLWHLMLLFFISGSWYVAMLQNLFHGSKLSRTSPALCLIVKDVTEQNYCELGEFLLFAYLVIVFPAVQRLFSSSSSLATHLPRKLRCMLTRLARALRMES